MKVWDPWVRLFHWAIVALLAAQWVTAEFSMMTWHLWLGHTVLALLLFRLVWGLVGSDTARFAKFLRSPIAALAHLRQFRHRGPDTEIGHNAAGGWMVLVMLGLLLAQVTSGLFANEEPGESYAAHGPLALRVDESLSRSLTGVHEWLFYVILGAVALHVVAVLAYALVKRHDLVRPMITGLKRLPAGARAPRLGSPALALALIALAAAVSWVLSRFGD